MVKTMTRYIEDREGRTGMKSTGIPLTELPEDKADWQELMERIEQITKEHRYKDLGLDFRFSLD